MKRDKKDIANPARREFITGAGATALVSGVSALVGSAQAQSSKPHVIIVGAGLAGLCAAYILQRMGWPYTILEAERDYVGGRVRTRPIGNLHWEAGAMRIPLRHEIARKYISMFCELKLQPFVMSSPTTFKYARGALSTDEAVIKKKYALSAAEREFSSDELWIHSVKDIATGNLKGGLSEEELRELRNSNTFTSSKLIQLDRKSLRQLMQSRRPDGRPPLSEEAIEFVLFASGNLTIQHGASTEFLREENVGVWDFEFSQIEGGTFLLPRAFLNRLSHKPIMGSEVIRLEQDVKRGRVRAIYKHNGSLEHAEGDFLICTIPFPALARVQVDPPFSHEKQRAILDIGYDSGTKVALLTKYRFWEKKYGIYGGTTRTDLITGPIIYPSDNALDKHGTKPCDPAKSDQPGVLLASYTWGQDARRLAAMPNRERIDFVITQVSQVHPEIADKGMILECASWAWDNYRWAGGAFAFYQPGQFSRMHEHVIMPEGRIYFAGEHCSHSHTWMEGALESAENVIAELVKRAG